MLLSLVAIYARRASPVLPMLGVSPIYVARRADIAKSGYIGCKSQVGTILGRRLTVVWGEWRYSLQKTTVTVAKCLDGTSICLTSVKMTVYGICLNVVLIVTAVCKRVCRVCVCAVE